MKRAFKLGVIGAGNMAEALVRGLITSGELAAGQIIAADVSPERRSVFSEQLHVQAGDDATAAAEKAEVILLSVKPQQMASVLASLAKVIKPEQLVVSIAAGLSTTWIASKLGKGNWRVIRVMPNTPMLVGHGASGMAAGEHATKADMELCRKWLAATSIVEEVPEALMDAVTAVSGSGPAYLFFLAEHMIEAGIKLGLDAKVADRLARRTLAGAARMLEASELTPQELRRRVTSPGGTTHAAIEHMEQQMVPQAVHGALGKARDRGRDLGKQHT